MPTKFGGPKPTDRPLVSAAVRIAGGWEGLVALTTCHLLSAKCTAIMHQRRPDDLSQAEVHDGGKLANLTGGNLQAQR